MIPASGVVLLDFCVRFFLRMFKRKQANDVQE